MLSASQQRAKDAEEMRARIDAERLALARTTEMGKHGAKTWASEAESLREKIGDFEGKLKRLKGQLAEMGFDENGVDLRANSHPDVPLSVADTHPTHSPSLHISAPADNRLRPSHSGDELADELKTSPIESTESGSSVDEVPEPGDRCADIEADLTRLLSFTEETREMRAEVDRAFLGKRDRLDIGVEGICNEADAFPEKSEDHVSSAKDIVCIVRAATNELAEATNRMDEIRKARREAEAEADGRELGIMKEGTDDKTEGAVLVDAAKVVENIEDAGADSGTEEKPSSKVESSMKERASTSLELHKGVVEGAEEVTKDAKDFSAKSKEAVKELQSDDGNELSAGEGFVDAISKPTWFIEAKADATISPERVDRKHKPKTAPGANVNTARDLQMVSKVLSETVASEKPHRASRSSRHKAGTRSLDSINLILNSAERSSSGTSRYDTDVMCSPSVASSMKSSRSVRFAELPPSYSAMRSCDGLEVSSSLREGRLMTATEAFPIVRKKPSDEVCEGTKSTGTQQVPSTDVAAEHQDAIDSVKPAALKQDNNEKRSVRKKEQGRLRVKESPKKIDLQASRASTRPAVPSAQRPPRIHRTQTPHRIVRPKEAIQRSVMPSSTSQKRRGLRSALKRSGSGDSSYGLQTPRGRVPDPASDLKDATDKLEGVIRPLSETKKVSPPKSIQSLSTDCQSPVQSGSASVQGCTEDSADEGNRSELPVQKRLFLTPETTTSSSKMNRQPQRAPRIESSLSQSSSVHPSTPSPRHSKDDIVVAPQNQKGQGLIVEDTPKTPSPGVSDEEVHVSSAPKPPLPRKTSNYGQKPRSPKAGGFFAGETAQWQQSVKSQRALSSSDGQLGEGFIARSSSESSTRSLRGFGSGQNNSSSGKKSRVQAFRARLAALQ